MVLQFVNHALAGLLARQHDPLRRAVATYLPSGATGVAAALVTSIPLPGNGTNATAGGIAAAGTQSQGPVTVSANDDGSYNGVLNITRTVTSTVTTTFTYSIGAGTSARVTTTKYAVPTTETVVSVRILALQNYQLTDEE